MLTDLDKQVVARDSSIPGLELLFDDASLLERLQADKACDDITSVHVDYLRYKPHTSCIGRLRIQTTDGESLAYAKAFCADAADKLAKAERSAAEAIGLHQFFAENALAVYRFPADRVLPALGQFTDASTLPHALRRLNADFAQFQDISLEPLHYKPERRFAAKLLRGDSPIAAVKLYTKRGYALARRAAKCFNRPQDRDSPRCIGHSDVHAALAFDWVDGTPLSAISLGDQRIHLALRKVGLALRAIHGQEHAKLPRKPLSQTVRMLRESLRELSWIAPILAANAVRVYQELVRRVSIIEGSESAPIHGDLHLNQILLTGDTIQLLDFDRACVSDPMEDFGRMYAALMQAEPDPHGTESSDNVFQELVETYVATDATVNVERISVYAASRLWETVCEPFRYRHSGWPLEVERRLSRVGQLLNRQSGGNHPQARAGSPIESNFTSRTIIAHDPFKLGEDHALVRGGDALITTIAKDLLARIGSYDGRHVGLDLHSIRVTRHKPGRRCVIEYAGKSLTTGEYLELVGKLDSKARYQRYFEQQCSLCRAGFEPDSADGICVAQPWNTIPEWNMWLQQKAPGENCWKALGGSEGCTVARRIAQAIHKLHSSSIKTGRSHSLSDELQIVNDRLRAAAIQAPHLAERIASLREACHDASEEYPIAADVPIHRDFYPDQVLVGRDDLVLIDFDLLAAGDPALDVGNFIGHLIEHSLRLHRHQFYYAAQQEAFLREYCRLSEVSLRAIRFFTALTLVRHIYLCLTLPGRSKNSRRVLDVASQLLLKRQGMHI